MVLARDRHGRFAEQLNAIDTLTAWGRVVPGDRKVLLPWTGGGARRCRALCHLRRVHPVTQGRVVAHTASTPSTSAGTSGSTRNASR